MTLEYEGTQSLSWLDTFVKKKGNAERLGMNDKKKSTVHSNNQFLKIK